MRSPAEIEAWLNAKELRAWLCKAPDLASYRRRLAIKLAVTEKFFAHQIAAMIGVSVQSIWSWIDIYNDKGPEGLEIKPRGGRRRFLYSLREEKAFAQDFLKKLKRGEIDSVRDWLPTLQKLTKKKVSLSYAYKMLHRHGWDGRG